MKAIALEEVEVIKPPFHATVEELVRWVKPTTVSIKGEHIICGGYMIHPRLFICSQLVDSGIVKIQFSDDEVVEAIFNDHKGDHFLSYYSADEEDARPDWVGLPNRTEPLDPESYLFSFVHDHSKDYVVRYKAIPVNVSQMFEAKEETGKLHLDDYERKHTYPVVDMFGYLVGINIGCSFGETVCEAVSPKPKL